MNFEHMPSLAWWWAYPLLLTLMVAMGVSMWVYFKRSEWI
jgi:magnesium transporter